MENKKILIINWRFENEAINTTSELFEVEGLDNAILQYSKYDATENSGLIALINKYISVDYEILVLTHTGDVIRNSVGDIIEKDDTIKNYSKIKIREFAAGNGHPYGILIHSAHKRYIRPQFFINDKVKNSNYTEVWDFFWNHVELENVKKKLIDSFLPLALDLQGLSEVKDNEVKEKYYYDVKSDVEANFDSILKAWNEIKCILGLRVDNNNEPMDFLSEEYRLTPEEKELTYFLIEDENNPGFSMNELLNLFSSHTKDNGNELFLWLNKVVDLMNEKLIPVDVNE